MARRWWRRRVVRWVAAGLGTALVAVGGPWLLVRLTTTGDRYAVQDAVPGAPVGLVLGAGVNADGTASAFLTERVSVAAQLYRRGTVRALLMSGDNSRQGYDEVGVMAKLAQGFGVPASAIVLDHAGFDTYSSCYRARQVFGLHRAVIVTQPFHLPRALWLCDSLGVASVGVATGSDPQGATVYGELRELPAAGKAVLDVVFHRTPTFPGPVEHSFDGLDGA